MIWIMTMRKMGIRMYAEGILRTMMERKPQSTASGNEGHRTEIAFQVKPGQASSSRRVS